MDRTPFIQAILRTAYAEFFAGGHYLLGADGGKPAENGGSCDGIKGRKIELLNVNKPDSVAIETAKYAGRLCHGRYESVGGYTLPLGKKEYLHDYLNQYCPEITWGYGMTPRSLDWTTVMIGESCKGRRHFDCIFFVNWVLTKALLKTPGPSYNIDQWSKGMGAAKVFERGVLKQNEIEDADIFIRTNTTPQHIGFFLAGGARLHASGANSGVVINSYSEKYTHIARLKDSFLKFGG